MLSLTFLLAVRIVDLEKQYLAQKVVWFAKLESLSKDSYSASFYFQITQGVYLVPQDMGGLWTLNLET
jgi:hypothetical protein